jgi:polysaccharide pyruvyl transferase CsaB
MVRTKKKGAVVVAGYYGFGNAGDELILLSTIQQLRKQKTEVDITVLSVRPRETAEHFGVKAVNRWHPWAWFGPLWRAELFILGGGGLLQESTGMWNHSYYLLLIALAKIFSCRTEVRAIGVDPIGGAWNRWWTRVVFNHWVNFPSVRDTDSQRALETSGVHARIWRVPDPVLQLTLPAVDKAPRKKPVIAWAVSPWHARPGWDHDLAFLMQRVASGLGVVNELLVFFPEKDQPLAQRISDLTSGEARVRIWSQPEELLTQIQEPDLVIAMRYHALVLAALAGKPFIGWGFQRKVRTLCRDFSQPMWTFERGWDSEAVFRQISDTWRRRESLPERFRSHVSQLIVSPPIATETSRVFVAQA